MPAGGLCDNAAGTLGFARPTAGDLLVLRIWRATLNSSRGLTAAARTEAAVREELIALALGIPLAFFITPFAWKRLALIGVILLLLAVEMLNTAIEKLADHVLVRRLF